MNTRLKEFVEEVLEVKKANEYYSATYDDHYNDSCYDDSDHYNDSCYSDSFSRD